MVFYKKTISKSQVPDLGPWDNVFGKIVSFNEVNNFQKLLVTVKRNHQSIKFLPSKAQIHFRTKLKLSKSFLQQFIPETVCKKMQTKNIQFEVYSPHTVGTQCSPVFE